jgi:hypothetical protein
MVRAAQLILVVVAVLAGACGPTPLDLTPFGGRWFGYLRPSILIEAGHRPMDLYHVSNVDRVVVAEDIEVHESYKDSDCVLWETKHEETHVVFASCGDHSPIVISSDDHHRWLMEPRGLVHVEPDRVNRDGMAVRPTQMFTIAAIAAASATQPPFSAARARNAPLADVAFIDEEMPIDVTETDMIGRTALLSACAISEKAPTPLPLVDALLARGADVNATDKYGNTALMIAADHAHADVVHRLVDAGAYVLAQNGDLANRADGSGWFRWRGPGRDGEVAALQGGGQDRPRQIRPDRLQRHSQQHRSTTQGAARHPVGPSAAFPLPHAAM